MKLRLLLLSIALFGVSVQADENICGKITSLRGKLEILRLINVSDAKNTQNPNEASRQGIIAENKMTLWCSDIIVTREASRAVVRLRNQTTMTVGPHSRLEIQNYLNGEKGVNQLKLTYGKVRTFLKPKKDKETKLARPTANKYSRLIIKTPGAVAGVRGTDFYLSYNPLENKTEQATLTGEVEVKNEVTGQTVSVPPGQQVTVDKIPDSVVEAVKKDLAKGKSLEEISKEKGLNAEIAAPTPIVAALKTQIQQTSSIAQNYQEFNSKDAVAVIGKPEDWKPPVSELPFDLKDLKEEF